MYHDLVDTLYIQISISYRYRHEVPNLLGVFTNSGNKNKTVKADKTAVPCSVCGDGKCDRERVVHNTKPWTGLMVPKEVDKSISDVRQIFL